VAGWSSEPASVRKGNQLVEYRRDNNLPVLGIRLTTTRDFDALSKAVAVVADGTLAFTADQARRQ
jgi:hypothetical protein